MEAQNTGSSIRPIQDVDAIAEKAKLQLEDLLPKAQTLYFSDDCLANASQLTLVEADAHVIDHVCKGGSLVIRGEPSDSAVLCTAEKTYSVREAETSNSLLLLQSLTGPNEIEKEGPRHVTDRQVAGTFYTYLELRECQPRLRRLHRLLSADPYRGRLHPGTGYSAARLAEAVQASREQLETALRESHALLMDGEYRFLECEYEFHVFSLITKFIDENSWSSVEVRRSLTLETLSELEPAAVVAHCFDKHMKPIGETAADGGEPLYTFCEDQVARLFARLLLQPMKTFNLADFTASWQQSVPDGVTTSVDQLRGLAVVNSEVSPQVVVRLAPTDLPDDAPERFAALFAVKQHWTADELHPYLEDLTSPSVKMGSLLAKNTRLTTKAGVKMYGPKHAH
ncbi:Sister chromatid cohesion protein DCC1 [Amphibalanus amphitrite]|uniref:Sister chromatid cohesion protein DCC1 n=1 Tax=Amphibalanus amphitrite TaxID=1232801 RepID=A0A6A4X3J8_AMPAM|nr:Sister chromatid cohesion protein DCC1 [Amphibalanus amphitrite]